MSVVNLRKAIPIIGAISSGKSFFVDSLLGLDILDSQSSITTKFVCIIQHNKNLKEPQFYQVNLDPSSYDENNMMIYNATRKGDIIYGHDNIKEKIKEINKIQKNVPNDEIKYEELFYVLEIEIKNIQNENLLNEYDFYDIPGLDEYITDNNKDQSEKEEDRLKKMRYVQELFKFFKSRIDFGVFVINAESAYANASKEVILNVANVIQPKKIHNYLVVLNKIDRQSEPKITVKKVKSIITNNLLNQLNLSDNIFIKLDSRQLKHQTLMQDSFEDYLFFLFNEYFAKAVIPFKDNREGSEEEKKFNTKNFSFFDFLSDYVTKGKDNNQLEEYLGGLEEKFNDNYEFDDLKINEIFEKIKKQENYKINFGIDPEEDETQKLFKYLYIKFREKDNLPHSEDVDKVLNYFNNIRENLEKSFYDDVAPPPVQLISLDFRKQFEDFTKQFKRFHEENKNFKIIGDLSKSIEQLYNYISNQKIIYIGIFGNSSTGKSVIYNNIFGVDILTVNENECTKRGVIIEDGDNIAMYKADSEIKNLNGREFNIFRRAEIIAVGEESVREMLEELNTEYAKDTDNGDLNYFIITIPIKFFDEINLDPEIRRSVKFIDLPGYNTSKSNNFIYEPVIKTISCFLMTFKASSIGSTDNAKSTSIYKSLKFKSERAVKSLNDTEFLKCCLFIINLWDKETPTKENLNDWSNSIKKYVVENFQNVDINLTYLNALLYHNYLDEVKYFFNYQYLQEEIFYIYSTKTFRLMRSPFIKFFAESLKKKIKDLFKIKENEIKQIISNEKDDEIRTQMNILFHNSYESTGFNPKEEKDYEKYLTEICAYLSYAQKNIKKIQDYKNSYIETFFKDLSDKIIFSKDVVNTDFKEHLKNAIDILNIFFNIDIENQNQEKKEKFIQESQALYQELKRCFQFYDFEPVFDSILSAIEIFFNSKMNEADAILEKNGNDIEKAAGQIIEEYKALVQTFQETIKNKYNEFIKEVDKIYNAIIQKLNLEQKEEENINVSNNDINIKTPVGALIGKVSLYGVATFGLGAVAAFFPPLAILTIPAGFLIGWFLGKSIGETLYKVFSKKARLIDALTDIKKKQLDEFNLFKERFLRDMNNKTQNLENNALSLINIKTLELSNKSEQTKEFYNKLKTDYENLLKSIKTLFDI